MRPPTSTVLRLENRHTGEVLEVRRQWRNGELTFGLRGTLPAHSEGPPLHIHHLEDEEGLIIAGTLSAEVDGQRLAIGPAKPCGSHVESHTDGGMREISH